MYCVVLSSMGNKLTCGLISLYEVLRRPLNSYNNRNIFYLAKLSLVEALIHKLSV